uniref:Interferon-related developmental regulator N-terminal domain-containing protein n=1 Tax=Setaria digitata TaxID=48799 RepID=A0A915PX93_9BILA
MWAELESRESSKQDSKNKEDGPEGSAEITSELNQLLFANPASEVPLVGFDPTEVVQDRSLDDPQALATCGCHRYSQPHGLKWSDGRGKAYEPIASVFSVNGELLCGTTFNLLSVVEVDVSDDSDDLSCTSHSAAEHDMHIITGNEEGSSDTVTRSDQLDACFDNAADKKSSMEKALHCSVSVRLAAMSNIRTLLSLRYVAADLEKWTTTLIAIIDKSLRKTEEEAKIAASLSALTSIQLGEKVASEIEPIISFLCQLCTDPSRSLQLRSQCARSVALCTFLSLEQSASILASVAALRSIWFGTKSSDASAKLFTIALLGWSLLVHQVGQEALRTALLDEPKLSMFLSGSQGYMSYIPYLLKLEMRLSAGKALAILHEAAVTTFGDKYQFPNQQHLLDIFLNLTTDSLKFRARKDRKIQRFTFRQIYASIKEQEAPVFDVKFGDETLIINSCGKKLLYDFICGVLYGNVNIHLRTNPILREWFDLEPLTEIFPMKMKKPQKIAMQNAINKTRDLQRSKQRNKRIVY